MEPKTILFVDDEEGVCQSWRRFLTDAGHTVTTAPDGESAILSLVGKRADLVISDVRLPGRSGLELLDWVRQRRPSLPVILMTGYGTPEIEARARELGAYAYFEKPVEPIQLLAAANVAIEGAHAPEAAPRSAEEDEAALDFVALPAAPEAKPLVEAKTEAAPQASESALVSLGWLLLAPLAGLAYVIFLPLVGFAFLGKALAKGIGRGFGRLIGQKA